MDEGGADEEGMKGGEGNWKRGKDCGEGCDGICGLNTRPASCVIEVVGIT